MTKNSTAMDMAHGPLMKNIFIFCVPLMFSYLLQIAFNAADTIVVGKFSGQQALAAVGATGSIVSLLVALFNGLSVGANILIAMQIGKKENKQISDSVHTAYFMAITGGLLLSIVGFFCSSPVLKLMNTPPDIIALSTLYMRIYFIGSIPLLIYDFGSSILRARGDTTGPTVILVISGVLNVFLNLVFVIGFKMSVAGVAAATVISEILSAVLITLSLMRQTDSTKLFLNKIKPVPEFFNSILQIGVPAGLQGMMWCISNVVIQSSINSFGSISVAGNSATQNIENFVYIGMQAFSQGCTTFTSQCRGAREWARIKKIMYIFCILNVVVSFIVGGASWLFGPKLLSLYTNDSDVIISGMLRMWFVVFWLWINALLDIPASSLRGMGFSTTPVAAMFIGIVGVRLFYIGTIWQSFRTLENLYLIFPVSWGITTIAMFFLWHICYRKTHR